MSTVLNFHSSRVSAHETWSEELQNELENPELAGLLVMVLNEKSIIVVLQHPYTFSVPYMNEDAELPEDNGIFWICDKTDGEVMELDGDGESELVENVLDILVSVLKSMVQITNFPMKKSQMKMKFRKASLFWTWANRIDKQ